MTADSPLFKCLVDCSEKCSFKKPHEHTERNVNKSGIHIRGKFGCPSCEPVVSPAPSKPKSVRFESFIDPVTGEKLARPVPVSESVKPDGIKLKKLINKWLEPVCSGEYIEDVVFTVENEAQAQHLALTADLRQEIEGRKSLEKELTESYERELASLKEVLELARETIKGWYDMGNKAEQYPEMGKKMWELYQQSPEMKRINQALAQSLEVKP